MIKCWTDDAWEEFEYWTEQDKKTLRQIKKLLINWKDEQLKIYIRGRLEN